MPWINLTDETQPIYWEGPIPAGQRAGDIALAAEQENRRRGYAPNTIVPRIRTARPIPTLEEGIFGPGPPTDFSARSWRVRPVAESIRQPYTQAATAEGQQQVFAEATATGYEIVRATPSTLLLDLDTVRDRKQFDQGLALCKEIWPDWGWATEEWASRSGNTHVKVTLNRRLGIDLRLALEMALGSDRTRGIYGLAKRINGTCQEQDISVLFKPSGVATEGDEE